jgi:hypothetical protein
MPSFTSLAIPALYQSSRQFAPRSMAALRQAQFSTKASQKPEVVTFEEIDSLIQKKDKVYTVHDHSQLSKVHAHNKNAFSN